MSQIVGSNYAPVIFKDAMGQDTSNFWTKYPSLYYPLGDYISGEEIYKKQIDQLAAAILLDDTSPQIKVESVHVEAATPFLFPEGSVLSGSFIMHDIVRLFTRGNVNIAFDDYDIYFQNKAQAEEFLKINFINDFRLTDNPMCTYGIVKGLKMNLIYGVPYTTPESLISKFDIRACSMAIDMNAKKFYFVDDAIHDATRKHIVFNSVPRSVSVRRLTKYIQKGFEIGPYQRLFFVELLKSPLYSPELELVTKDY